MALSALLGVGMMADIGKVLGDLVLVAMLPGFLAAKVRDLITDRSGNQTLSTDLVRAMMYWLPILALLWVASKAFLPSILLFPTAGGLQPVTIVSALVAAVPVGLAAGILGETRWARDIAFRLRLTRKTWKTPWLSAFQEAEKKGCWAVVWLEDGTRFEGWPKYVSDDGDAPLIYLHRVDGAGDGAVRIRHPRASKWVDVPGIGVLLPPSAKIKHVDFLDPSIPLPEGRHTAGPTGGGGASAA